jgi:hypothetical protein
MTSFIGNIKNAVIRFNKKIMEAIISWEFTMGWQAISTSSREVHVVNFFVSNMSNSTNMDALQINLRVEFDPLKDGIANHVT